MHFVWLARLFVEPNSSGVYSVLSYPTTAHLISSQNNDPRYRGILLEAIRRNFAVDRNVYSPSPIFAEC